MSIGRIDAIVQGTQVGGCSDEVDVVVGIIIFFELNRSQSVADERRGRR